jgi:osmoprotectant transport system substrate-binding protein
MSIKILRSNAVLAFALLLTSCGPRSNIVVASKNFTEQVILGEIAAQQIERRMSVHVDRKLNLGGTLLAQQALVSGQIDLYPEYTGTALTAVLKQPPTANANAAFETVSRMYLDQFRLKWLKPLGFDDTFAMVVKSADANSLPAPTLSAAAGREWRLGVGYEFLTRADGLARLDDTYHFRWRGDAKTMDLGLLYQALEQSQIDMAAANSTDGLLSSSRFAVLADDRHAFPPYQACFVVRVAALNKDPRLESALAELSGKLDEKTMRELNRRVDQDHEPVVQVAHDFLASH